MIKHKLLLATAFVATLFAFGTINPVSAAEGESIVMSPAAVRADYKAGQTVDQKFTIFNDGTVDFKFTVYAAPYSVIGRQYNPDYDSKVSNSDVYTWVSFKQKDWSLKAGESVDIPYTISVPEDAAPGGHYSVLFAETTIDNQTDGQIKRQKRVGAIVYASVDGDVIRKGRLVSSMIPWIKLGDAPSVGLTYENTGNVHFTSSSTIKVKSITGAKIYEKTAEYIILPKTTRDVDLKWENGSTLGLYQVETESDVLGKKTSKSSYVLATPPWFLLVTLGVVVAIGWILFRARR